jgi:hypothetical protein
MKALCMSNLINMLAEGRGSPMSETCIQRAVPYGDQECREG